MNKFFVRIFVLVIFMLFVLLSNTCKKSTTESQDDITEGTKVIASQGGVLTSPDGLLTLTIPAGALQDDTYIDIKVLPQSDYPEVLTDIDIVGEVYIFFPEGLEKGALVISGEAAPIRPGNCLPLGRIPVGTVVHNVELQPGRGGQMARGAGSGARVAAREGNYVHLSLPSGEVRLVLTECRATVGRVSNIDHSNVSDGKAGRARWRGKRPHVRGSAMNPVDHPHGGGEGKAPIGHPSPLSPWGKKTLGKITRNRTKPSNKYIVRQRRARR